MNKLSKFLFLPFSSQLLLVQSFILVALIRVSLWIFTFEKLNNRLLRLSSTGSESQSIDWMIINRIVASVIACSQFVPQASCLTQALATRTLLSLNGQSSHLKIGVEKEVGRDFAAHAWIEVDGRIVIGKLPGHRRFTVLDSANLAVL